MASQQQSSTTPPELRDRLQTPRFIFDYFNELLSFDVDVCAEDAIAAKCPVFITPEIDGLSTDWCMFGERAWCNPPYSEQALWIYTAQNNACDGMMVAMLLPSFNGQSYWEFVFSRATKIINIVGRIPFEAPEAFTKKVKVKRASGPVIKEVQIKKGDPIPGNTGGSCIVIFGKIPPGITLPDWVHRDDMVAASKDFML